jgi:hypothetical protein
MAQRHFANKIVDNMIDKSDKTPGRIVPALPCFSHCEKPISQVRSNPSAP